MPSNEELNAKKIQVLPENSRRVTEDSVKVDVPAINLESPSVPIKVIMSPKKFHPASQLLPAVQQPFKNPQSFVSLQQQTQMVSNYYSYILYDYYFMTYILIHWFNIFCIGCSQSILQCKSTNS